MRLYCVTISLDLGWRISDHDVLRGISLSSNISRKPVTAGEATEMRDERVAMGLH